ncbi:hypothetical protein [Terriglobus sp. RCC_193]|uniref:hypothetical protein n=1 Tax=Terriglobus sp. RCC_193 TaxID=3239218 RepID=UPI003523492E
MPGDIYSFPLQPAWGQWQPMVVGAVAAASSQYREQYLPSVTVQLQGVWAHFFGSWDIGGISSCGEVRNDYE